MRDIMNINQATIDNRNRLYFVEWKSLLGGGSASIPSTTFDEACKIAKALPCTSTTVICDVPERMTTESWVFIQGVQE